MENPTDTAPMVDAGNTPDAGATSDQPIKILVGTNQPRLQKYKSAANSMVKLANEFGELYPILEIGTFDKPAMIDAICNNGHNIRQKYIETAQELAKSFPLPSMRNEAVKLAGLMQNPFGELLRKNHWITSDDKEVLERYISVDATGTAVITAESEKQMFEDCSIFATNEDEVRKFTIHRTIIALLNDFFDNGGCIPLFKWWEYFPSDDNGVFRLPEYGTDYAVMVEKTAQRNAPATGSAPASPDPPDVPPAPATAPDVPPRRKKGNRTKFTDLYK